MIYLRTGLPGTGKTLISLDEIIKYLELPENQDRPVFYYNITFYSTHDLYHKVEGWKELTKKDLLDLPLVYDIDNPDEPSNHPIIPKKSIIIIDECQSIFPKRDKGAVPPHIEFLEVHRHPALDFFLITQKTRQIDIHVRDLVGDHKDYKRILGRDAVRCRHLGETIEGKKQESEELQTSVIKYPKQYYGLYKSAEIHTHKKKLPLKVTLGIPAILLFMSLMGYVLYSVLLDREETQPKQEQQSQSQPSNYQPVADAPTPKPLHDALYIVGEWEYNGLIQPFFLMLVRTHDGLRTLNLSLSELLKMGYDVERINSTIYHVNGVLVTTRPKLDYPDDYHIEGDGKNQDKQTRSNPFEEGGDA